jgi:hypothetical protein
MLRVHNEEEINIVRKTDYTHYKDKTKNHFPILYSKMISKWIKDLDIKLEIMKFL